MQGAICFLPLELSFFDEVIQPLVAGRRVNPETWVQAALRFRLPAETSDRYRRALELAIERSVPPDPPSEAGFFERVRMRLERFDFRPDRVATLAARAIDRDLHLRGRPFLVGDGSADRVAEVVDEYLGAEGPRAAEQIVLAQLKRIDAELSERLEPEPARPLSADAHHRRDLLEGLRLLHDLAGAAREGRNWGSTALESAREVLARELPWRAVWLHNRAVPVWVAQDVDGLETICGAAGIAPPPCLVPAWRLFGPACDEFPALRETLGLELSGTHGVGAFAAPEDLEELQNFLNLEGARIIQAATRHDEGTSCATLLRKIRECVAFARRHGMGYLEASGALPVGLDEEEDCPVFFRTRRLGSPELAPA